MYEIIYFGNGVPKFVKRISDGAAIPFDPRNLDFADFLVWNAQQATPLDWQTPIAPTYTWAMTCNKTTIAGGLGDVATVTIITTDPTATSASVTVNGAAQSVTLTNGVGVLEITADLPRTVVEVVGVGELAGKTLKVFAI